MSDTPETDFCPRCGKTMRIGDSLCPACEKKAQRQGETGEEGRFDGLKVLGLILAALVLTSCVLLSLFGPLIGF